MKLKGFKKSDGSIAKIYTDPTLTESDSPADAASVKAKDDLLQQGITNKANYAAGLNTRLSELENGAPSIIAPKVTEWLDANVDPTGSAVTVDSSLTIAGSAADAKKTGDELSNLKSDLSEIAEEQIGKNLVDPAGVIVGYVDSNGTIDTTSTTYRATGYVPVSSGETYAFSAFDANNYRKTSRYTCAFYNASKEFISGSYTNTQSTNQLIVSAPSGAVYFRGCCGGNPSKLQLEHNTTVTPFSDYTRSVVIIADIPKLDELDELINDNVEVTNSSNLCDMDTCVVGLLEGNGKVSSSDAVSLRYKTSDFIPVNASSVYTMSIWADVNTPISSQRCIMLCFDSEKSVISGTYISTDSTHSIQQEIPSNAAFVRISSNANLMMLNNGDVPTAYVNYDHKVYLAFDIKESSLPYQNYLYKKKWVVCGDSFTNDGGTGTKMPSGVYKGQPYTYPWIIGTRQNMEIVKFFGGGRTLAFPAEPGTFANSLTNPSASYYYQNIPSDVDYITFYLGINDEHHATGGGDGEDSTGVIPLGTIDDNDTTTYYGAWNVVLTWLITNRPNAHIGIIVTNGLSIEGYRTAQIAIARKYGIPFIDLNGDDRTPAMLRSVNPNIPSTIKQALIAKWAVDPTGTGGTVNTHPNDAAQLFESTFIENFLRSI